MPNITVTEEKVINLKLDAGVVAERYAKEYSRESEAWAIGTKDGVPVPNTAAQYHNNSEYYKDQSASYANDSHSWSNASQGYANAASASADTASGYANQASGWAGTSAQAAAASGQSATASSQSANAASASALDSEAWAKGTRNGNPVPSSDDAYHDNALYWAEKASESSTSAYTQAQWSKEYKNQAQDFRNGALSQKLDAEAWANGQKDGVDVDSSDPAYHNNSKYWSEESNSYQLEAKGWYNGAWSAARESESWAKGTREGTPVPSTDPAYENNAKYWAEQAEETVAHSGLMDFTITESGHLIYTKTPTITIDFDIDEDGHLIVS